MIWVEGWWSLLDVLLQLLWLLFSLSFRTAIPGFHQVYCKRICLNQLVGLLEIRYFDKVQKQKWLLDVIPLHGLGEFSILLCYLYYLCTLSVNIYRLRLIFIYFLSVAPMMECTDNHYRTLARLISKHAWLYTEMLAAETIVYQKDNLVSLRQNPLDNN